MNDSFTASNNNTSNELSFANIGYVLALKDVIASEIVRFNGTILGLAINLEENVTGVTIFGNDRNIKQGDYVERLYTILEIAVSTSLIGRVIDSLGNYIDESVTEEVENIEEDTDSES